MVRVAPSEELLEVLIAMKKKTYDKYGHLRFPEGTPRHLIDEWRELEQGMKRDTREMG